MAKLDILAGATSVSIELFLQDSSSTTGAGLTGLLYNSAGLTAYWNVPGGVPAAITLATLAANNSAWGTGGFIAVDATNKPGCYRLDLPNAVIAAGRSVVLVVRGATNLAQNVSEVQLTAVNNQSSAAFLTGVNGLAAPTNWNLHAIDASGRVDVGKWLGTAAALVGGLPSVNMTTVTAGIIAAATFAANALDAVWSTAVRTITGGTITTYTGNTPQTGDNYVRIGAAGAGLTALGDTRIANLDATITSRSNYAGGPVASVTGAVGSVTGNVGGSVASVTAGVTVTTYTGNTPQTGDSFARLGAAGAGLTALGDTRIANLDAAITSRSNYAGGDTSGTTTLLARLSAIRAGLLDNLDAAITSRSNYAGADTGGTTTLLARLTSIRAGLLDNLDAAITSRSNYAGGPVASVTGAVGSVTGNVGGSVASVTAPVSVTGDLTATMKASVTTAATASTPVAASVTGAVGSVTAGVTLATDAMNANALATDAVTELVAGVFARAFGANFSNKTFAQLQEAQYAAIFGPSTGAGTTAEVFQDLTGGTKVTVNNNGTDRTSTVVA